METTLLIAASRQSVLRRQLSMIANNVANTDTAGFKAQRMMMETFPVRTRGDGPLPVTLNFVEDAATMRVTHDGGLSETGSRLDVALRGDGHLVVETADGPRYTRNGRMRVDVEGMLVTEAGDRVMSPTNEPLLIGADTADLTIGRDGTITNRNGVLGRLQVVRFANPSAMQPAAGGMLSATETPQPMADPEVIQGSLEGSNVEPVLELTRLIDVHRAYDRTRKMVEQEDERMKRMIDSFTRSN